MLLWISVIVLLLTSGLQTFLDDLEIAANELLPENWVLSSSVHKHTEVAYLRLPTRKLWDCPWTFQKSTCPWYWVQFHLEVLFGLASIAATMNCAFVYLHFIYDCYNLRFHSIILQIALVLLPAPTVLWCWSHSLPSLSTETGCWTIAGDKTLSIQCHVSVVV
jgi:hypothetical protein